MSQAISSDCMKEAIALLESKGYRVCGSSILWPNTNIYNGPSSVPSPPAKFRDYPDYSLSFVPAWSPPPQELKSDSVADLVEKIKALPIAEIP